MTEVVIFGQFER